LRSAASHERGEAEHDPPADALHLGTWGALSGTAKKLSGEDGNLLDLFDVQEDAIPLFVSEGRSRDKLSAITRNDYLSFAYQRFSKHRGSLVIFGHSLTPEFDQHLIEVEQEAGDLARVVPPLHH